MCIAPLPSVINIKKSKFVGYQDNFSAYICVLNLRAVGTYHLFFPLTNKFVHYSNQHMKKFIILTFSILFFSQILSAQCISGDCKNGTGIFVYTSGAKYVGQFKDGEIHGIGTCYYTDGSVYRGQWVHRFPEGEGTKTLEDGREWRGQWLKGQPTDENGNPIEIFVDEEVLVDDGTNIQSGCLAGDCSDGEGVFAYPDGSKFEGQFLAGKPDGWGTFHFTNGDRYIGSFKFGFQHGKGTLYHPDETQTVGEWREGEYMGNPTIEQGQIGCISGNCENGRGMLIYPEGAAKYIGNFVDGQPNGEGVINYSNGERYKGNWKEGSYDGEGTLYLMDGTKVTGYWAAGTYMGEDDPNAPKEEDYPEVVTDALEDIIAFRDMTDMKVWAVVVGVSSYNHMPTLRYTDDDAYRMYAFLKSPEGGALADDQIRILIDEDATKEKITRTMSEVFGQAKPNDLVLLYFSGHGLKGSFLPIDFDGYNNKLEHDEINLILKKSPAKYKLCIADACHSGSLLAMKSGNVRNVLEEYYTSLAQAEAGTALIMSSKSDETSLESSGLRQGVFSHFLIRGLKGEADENENKIVTIKELYDYIEKNVRTYTGNRQSPIIKGDYDPRMTVSVVR